jgi:hypothetical protein
MSKGRTPANCGHCGRTGRARAPSAAPSAPAPAPAGNAWLKLVIRRPFLLGGAIEMPAPRELLLSSPLLSGLCQPAGAASAAAPAAACASAARLELPEHVSSRHTVATWRLALALLSRGGGGDGGGGEDGGAAAAVITPQKASWTWGPTWASSRGCAPRWSRRWRSGESRQRTRGGGAGSRPAAGTAVSLGRAGAWRGDLVHALSRF